MAGQVHDRYLNERKEVIKHINGLDHKFTTKELHDHFDTKYPQPRAKRIATVIATLLFQGYLAALIKGQYELIKPIPESLQILRAPKKKKDE